MTDKLNCKNVTEILDEICLKNGLVLNVKHNHHHSLTNREVIRYIDFDFHDPIKGTFKGMRIYPERCTLTLYGFLESVMGFFFEHHLTKNNFDWSYYMKKAFTKADLKNGDVIKWSDGKINIVCIDTGALICKPEGYNSLEKVTNDLKWAGLLSGPETMKIIAIRRPKEPYHCCFNAFDKGYGELVYERSEPVEMTLEEVCEALGKEIKIVKR